MLTEIVSILSIAVLVVFSSTANAKTMKKDAIEVTWYGHAAATVYDGKTRILIDPFFTGNPKATISWDKLPKIDYILITHDHADHIGDVVAIAKHFKAKVSGVVETMEALKKSGLPEDLLLNGIGFNIGGTIALGDFTALMIPAVHTSASGVPVGYIITAKSGFRVYHAGDTAPFGDMKMWANMYPVDLAMLPVGGYFTEDAVQTVQAIKLMQPKYILPIHYGTFPILAQNLDALKKEIKKSKEPVKLLEPKVGESVSF